MKKIKNLIRNIGKLFVFSVGFLGLIGLIVLLGGWTYDPTTDTVKSDNLVNAPDRTGRWWVTNQSDISSKINELTNGTYTISCDLTPLSIDNGYLIDNCFFLIQITNGQYSGDGIITQINDFTYLGETKRGSITFNKLNYNDYVFRLWGFGNHNGGNHGEGKCSNIMLNESSSALPYEPYGTYVNKNEYDNLENQYEQLQENIVDNNKLLLNEVNVSVGNVPNQPSYDYTKTSDLVTSNYINQTGFIDIASIYNTYINSGNNNTIHIKFDKPMNVFINNQTYNFMGSPNVYLKYNIVYNEENIRFGWSYTGLENPNEYLGLDTALINYYGNTYITQYMAYTELYITYENRGNNLVNIQIGDNSGYSYGYNDATTKAQEKINEKNQELEQKQKELEQKQVEYDTLLEHYNNANLENPLSQMVISIADVPMNLFHSMFNFDIMGFNIAAFILSIITILLVAYVIKLLL